MRAGNMAPRACRSEVFSSKRNTQILSTALTVDAVMMTPSMADEDNNPFAMIDRERC